MVCFVVAKSVLSIDKLPYDRFAEKFCIITRAAIAFEASRGGE